MKWYEAVSKGDAEFAVGRYNRVTPALSMTARFGGAGIPAR